MNQSPGQNRRRNVLSLPGAQMRIILVFGVLGLVYALVNFFISKCAFHNLADAALNLPLPVKAQRDLQIIAGQHEAVLDLQLSLFTFLSFCMLCLAGVLISHRLGGPVFHLKKYMAGLVAGDTQPRAVKFRKGDFFHDLAESFNRFQEHHGIVKRGPRPPAGDDAA